MSFSLLEYVKEDFDFASSQVDLDAPSHPPDVESYDSHLASPDVKSYDSHLAS